MYMFLFHLNISEFNLSYYMYRDNLNFIYVSLSRHEIVYSIDSIYK